MVWKFALTGSPLSGKTMLANHLRDQYGFMVASHSLTIVQGYVDWYNDEYPPGGSTVEHVYLNKEEYRQELQRYAHTMGFDDPVQGAVWVKRTLSEWLKYKPERSVVFSETRGEGQVQVLRDLGFEIVQIEITEMERRRRAIELGRDIGAIWASMDAAPELERGIAHPDITLRGDQPVVVMGRVLIDRGARATGYTIFGNRVGH